MSHTPNLNLSYDKKGIRARGGHFPGFNRERERREEEETQELPSRSTEFHWSVFIEPSTKVHRIDEVHVGT